MHTERFAHLHSSEGRQAVSESTLTSARGACGADPPLPCRPDATCMRLRDACIDLYDPRLLALFYSEPNASVATSSGSGNSRDSPGSAAPAHAGLPWHGLHRIVCDQRRSLPSRSAMGSHTAADGDDPTASTTEERGVGAASSPGAAAAEAAAIESAAAAVMHAPPAAAATAALEHLRQAPRVAEAEVRGTALDLAGEGVKFAFAGPGEAAEQPLTAWGSPFLDSIQQHALVAEVGKGDAADQMDQPHDALVEEEEAGGGAPVPAGAAEGVDVDLAHIADLSEIMVAKKEAEDAAGLEQSWDPQRAKQKMQMGFQTYLEVCAVALVHFAEICVFCVCPRDLVHAPVFAALHWPDCRCTCMHMMCGGQSGECELRITARLRPVYGQTLKALLAPR